MDFSYSQQQLEIKRGIREWGKKHLTEEAIAAGYKNRGIAPEIAKAWGDDGWGMYGLPEEYGGKPVDHQTMAMIIEELNHCGGNIPMAPNLLIMFDMVEFGTPEQIQYAVDYYKENGYPPYCLAISEPDGGSDTMAMKTSCQTVDGRLLLNGRKSYVNNGEYAPYILVAAIDKDAGDTGRYPSLSFWLVPRSVPGINAVPISKIGQSMLPFALISFDDVELSPEWRLDASEGGFQQLFHLLEYGRVRLCASSLGMAQAAMDDAVAHARSRKAFGVQVGRFQQIETLLTDMEVRLRNMRSMVYRAAWSIDAADETERLDVALMKRYVPEASVQVASDAMQILGGLGYTEGSRVSRIWEDCRGNQIAEGTDQVMVYIAAPLIMEHYRSF